MLIVRSTQMTSSRNLGLRRWVAVGTAILVMAVGVAVWLRMPPAHSVNVPALASPSGPTGAVRAWDASEALRAGRFDEALGFYRDLPATDWRSDDCLALGSALLERDRVGLGRAALEAARRIDPKDRASFDALYDFEHEQAATTGPELLRRQAAVRRVEPLRSIPGGPPLGLLVLALARYAAAGDQEDEFLDRLGSRDSPLLERTRTPGDAINMIARLLLETGRASEARDLLEPGVNTRSQMASTVHSLELQKEAAWLMSRAALQLGAHDTADAMLKLAGNPGKSVAAGIEPSPFVGSRRCGECHRSIYRAQQGETGHAETLRFGTDLKDVPLPQGSIADQAVAGITHSFKRENDQRIELESRDEWRAFRAVVDYAVGSGRHGITMLASDHDGIEHELRISYFGLDGTWGQTKGIEFAPQHAADLIGLRLGPDHVNHCLSCHSTWFRSIAPMHAGVRPPEAEDRGIGCERCHGPGLNHVKAAETGFAELAIALTVRTPPRAQLDSCVECHKADGTVPPSDPEFTRFHGTTFLWSRCFLARSDSFSCTTCHDPHAALETDSTRYEAICLRCHAARNRGEPGAEAGTTLAQGLITPAGAACPVNPNADCISCHMPKVSDPSRHARFTDHHIRAHGRSSPRGDCRG
jgi:predicted CXXCH cytochrome family protein